ncbi:MAG TPA: nitrilase-related carbon-nitrogen hydrolase [Armatimonadota bacterium]|jgi:apolipoprotein N-acyltransferase
MKPDRAKLHRLIAAILAGTLTVALYSRCFPPFNLPYIAWFAPVPLLIVIPRLSLRSAEWFGFLTGYALYAINFRWLYAIFGFPAVALWGLLALFMAVFCVLVRSLPADCGLGRRLLLIPCFWVAVEYVRCEQWPLRFSWLAMGYSQHNSPLILPLAGYVGVYGLSFLILAIATCLVAACRRQWWPSIIVAGGIALMLSGTMREDATRHQPTAKTGRVVLIQSGSHSIRELMARSDAALERRSIPTIVAWPEYALENTDTEDPDAYARIADWASSRNVALVFGGTTSRGENRYSSAAYVLGPDGGRKGVYEKHNPLPFFKDGEPGAAYPVFFWRLGDRVVPFGATICFDLSFERNARMLARSGARFIVVPSGEPSNWPRLEQAQHAIVAPLRAAENGIGILRCSAPGPSQIVSPSGRVRRSLDAGVEGAIEAYPAFGDGRRTIYNRFGWLIPVLCQVVTLLWVLSRTQDALIRRRSARLQQETSEIGEHPSDVVGSQQS